MSDRNGGAPEISIQRCKFLAREGFEYIVQEFEKEVFIFETPHKNSADMHIHCNTAFAFGRHSIVVDIRRCK